MRKTLYLILCILTLALFACNKPTENAPTGGSGNQDVPSDNKGSNNGGNEGQPSYSQYSTELFVYGEGYSAHVTGGYMQDWGAHADNHMKPISIQDVARYYSTEVADYLTEMNEKYSKNGKPGINALYIAEDYVLDNQPENASAAPALVKNLEAIGLTEADIDPDNIFEEGYLIAFNQGYAVKCIRGMYDDLDETYFEDRWISDPKVANTESLTPDTLFMPKWVEHAAEGEKHLGEWTDNPVCIAGAGLYAVLMVEYNAVSSPEQAGFGIGLFKIASLVETPLN